MADQGNITFTVELKGNQLEFTEKFKKGMKEMGEEASKAGEKTKQASSTFSTMFAGVFTGAAAFDAAKAGFQALVNVVKEGVVLFEKQEKATLQLKNAISQTGLSYEYAKKELDAYTESRKASTLFSGSEIKEAEAKNMRASKSIEVTKLLTDISLNFATATGKALPEASQAISKAFNGQTEALNEVGIVLTAAEKKTLATGTAMEKAELLTSIFAKTMSGAATDAAKGFAGEQDKANKRIDDLKLKLGQDSIPLMTAWNESLVVVAGTLSTVYTKLSNVIQLMGKGPSATQATTSFMVDDLTKRIEAAQSRITDWKKSGVPAGSDKEKLINKELADIAILQKIIESKKQDLFNENVAAVIAASMAEVGPGNAAVDAAQEEKKAQNARNKAAASGSGGTKDPFLIMIAPGGMTEKNYTGQSVRLQMAQDEYDKTQEIKDKLREEMNKAYEDFEKIGKQAGDKPSGLLGLVDDDTLKRSSDNIERIRKEAAALDKDAPDYKDLLKAKEKELKIEEASLDIKKDQAEIQKKIVEFQKKYGVEAQGTQIVADALKNTVQSTANALANSLVYGEDLGKAFEEMGKQILQQMASQIINLGIMITLATVLDALGGGALLAAMGAGVQGLSLVGAFSGGTKHTGGYIDGSMPSYHSGGLAPNERIAKVLLNEYVMQPKATAALGKNNLDYMNNTGRIPGGNSYSVTVNAPGSTGKDADKIARTVGRAIKKQQRQGYKIL